MLLYCHINLVRFEKLWLFKIFGMTYNLERREYNLLSCIVAGKNAWDELGVYFRISHFNFPATFHAGKRGAVLCPWHSFSICGDRKKKHKSLASSKFHKSHLIFQPPSLISNQSILIPKEKSSLHLWTITKVQFLTLNYKTG